MCYNFPRTASPRLPARAPRTVLLEHSACMDRRARAGRNDRTHTGDSAGYVGDASIKQSASRCLFLPFEATAIARRLHNGYLLLAAACLRVGHGIGEHGAPHRMPVAWTRGARAGDVAWRDPGTFVYATIKHHEGLPRGACASGLHIVEGVGENLWHGERHFAGFRHLTQIGKVPYPVSDGLPHNIQTVRNLLLRRTRQPQCQRIPDCPSCNISAQSGFVDSVCRIV